MSFSWNKMTDDQSLTTTYKEVYSATGLSREILHAVLFCFTDSNVTVRVKTDDVVQAELDLKLLDTDFHLGPTYFTDPWDSPIGWLEYNADRWCFKPPAKMEAATSIKIDVKMNTGTGTLSRGLVVRQTR